MVLDSFFNALFGSLIEASPLWAIITISFIFTLIITIVYKITTDQELIKGFKKDLKRLRDEMKELKSEPEKLMELQKQSMEISMKQFKHTLKPTAITFIPLAIAFWWMKSTFSDFGTIALGMSWIWIYIISSIIFSITIRKILRVN